MIESDDFIIASIMDNIIPTCTFSGLLYVMMGFIIHFLTSKYVEAFATWVNYKCTLKNIEYSN